jgi:hypothetical protein
VEYCSSGGDSATNQVIIHGYSNIWPVDLLAPYITAPKLLPKNSSRSRFILALLLKFIFLIQLILLNLKVITPVSPLTTEIIISQNACYVENFYISSFAYSQLGAPGKLTPS